MPLSTRRDHGVPGIQLISFSIEQDFDIGRKIDEWMEITIPRGTTVARVCAERGHPDQVREVADYNKIRSIYSKLGRNRLKVPGNFRDAYSLDVLPGDAAPRVVGGYSKFGVIDRPKRTGITDFEGYDPMRIEIPIRFEAWTVAGGERRSDAGIAIERDITLLERMAGRGPEEELGIGPPPVVKISTTNAQGDTVPLIPLWLQAHRRKRDGLRWRIVGIDWDPNPLRNSGGKRMRQLAVVTLQEHTRVVIPTRSASARAKARKKKRSTKKKAAR